MNKYRRPREGMVEHTGALSQLTNFILAALLAGIAFCAFVPLWHVLMASISEGERVLAQSGILWCPAGFANLNGYQLIFQDASIVRGYLNTIMYVVLATGLGVIINTLGAYTLSQPSRFRMILVFFVVFTSLFSGGLVPTYMVIRSLGMVGTPLSLIIPGCTNAFFLLMLMNGFRRVPESTVESARIDGAGHIRVMFRIMLPQARGMLLVTIINSVVMQWNSWFPASIYVTNQRHYWPLQLWIRQIVSENVNILQSANPNFNRWLIQYAVIIAATLPILLVFPFFQKQLEKGMLVGSVKE
ncbi:MAG: carbohydrate ABC transporter permease [Oscillospiraceae bacterium]|nr:carbohydrate ABC transporter permease [Oscillospiraceae bacterium]